MCKIWFPFETFMFLSLTSLSVFIKKNLKTAVSLSTILKELITILQDYRTGIFVSYMFSVSYLLLILHGTYAIDLSIIRYLCMHTNN